MPVACAGKGQMDGAGIVLCFVDFECRCVETENGAKAAANRGRVFELDGVSCFFFMFNASSASGCDGFKCT